ncbi:MAG TPA: hypothetical protein VFK05_24415 [Polyangiaceae bacterium]|nr:hypothetical protein [Polyangiaceae bacterium]
MFEPLRTTSRLAVLVAWLSACGAAPAPAPQIATAEDNQKLERAKEAHADLEKQLAAAKPELLTHCKTRGEDCLITVAERRDELISKHYLNPCRGLDADQQSPCVARELEQHALRAELTSFYETENWCSHRLLECVTNTSKDAEQMAIRERAQKRRERIEAAPEAVAAAHAPEFAKEKLSFVRAILPPKGQAECAPTKPEACEIKLKAPAADYEAELARAPADYDAKRAQSRYVALQTAEAECTAPERNCLLGQLAQYGGTPETDKLLKQNLELIAQQQKLRLTADPDAAEQCNNQGVAQYSGRIVDTYQAYAAEPGTYLLQKLQKTFISMHQAQLWCLMPLAKKR